MKRVVLLLAGFFTMLFSTESFSNGSLFLMQKQMVHLSGSTQRPTTTKTVAPATRRTTTSHSSTTYRKKRRVSGGKSHKSGSGIYRTNMNRSSSTKAPRARRVIRRRDIEDLLDGDKEPKLDITVVSTDGTLFNASSISSGVNDMLRFESGGKKQSIDLNGVTLIDFGKKSLNRLSVVVQLETGEKLRGHIYPRYIFEFKSNGSVVTSLANQLNYINIQAE